MQSFFKILFLNFFSTFFVIIGYTQDIIQIINLRCENQNNPIAIDKEQPRFSWMYNTKERNVYQSTYQIIVSDNITDILDEKGSMWQSGNVSSGNNVFINYCGKKLKSFTKYYWKVKVSCETKNGSNWSEIATFETAALKENDWKAKWIFDGQQQFTKTKDFYRADRMPLFRKQVFIRRQILNAKIFIAGLGYSEIYINDVKAHDDFLNTPFTSYRKQILYNTYDVTKFLVKEKGFFTLGVMLGNGWYNPLPLQLFGKYNLRDFQETGRPKLFAELHILYEDGTKDVIPTDETWQTTKGPIIKNNVYLGEEYDATLEKSFLENKTWKKVKICSKPSGILNPQKHPLIKSTVVVKPLSIAEVGKDTFILDFGQNFAGFVRLKIKTEKRKKISIRYAELLNEDGSLNCMTTNAGHIKEVWKISGGPGAPKTAFQNDIYHTKGTLNEIWNPRFTFHGFRFIEVVGWPGKPSLSDFEGLRLNCELELDGNIITSDSLLNQIHNTIQWTFLSNVFGVQSDCPAREKMGYGADIVATATSYLYNYNMYDFYIKTIQDFENDQQKDGGITEIAPYTGIAVKGYGNHSGPLGWQLVYSYLQKKIFEFYGDTLLIKEHYTSFKKQLFFLENKTQQGLFWWDIGDHEAIERCSDAFAASCFYYHHLKLAVEFAKILKLNKDEMYFKKSLETLRNNIRNTYYSKGTGRIDNGTQSAQVFGLWYELSLNKEKSFDWLVKEIERNNKHISTGIFSTMMLFDVLENFNYDTLALTMLKQENFPGWVYMLKNGATTLWESWEKPVSASWNHPMFGSVNEWYYKSILGISLLETGFKKIKIKPKLTNQIASASGYYHSIMGKIEVKYYSNQNILNIEVTTPPNTTAEVWLPVNNNDSAIYESGKLIETNKNIQLINSTLGYKVYSVGNGSYHFRIIN